LPKNNIKSEEIKEKREDLPKTPVLGKVPKAITHS
jgi:hypothetical protein